MEKKSYSEIINEINRQWETEGVNNYTEFQKTIASIMRDVAESKIIADNSGLQKDGTFKNRFYSAVWKRYQAL